MLVDTSQFTGGGFGAIEVEAFRRESAELIPRATGAGIQAERFLQGRQGRRPIVLLNENVRFSQTRRPVKRIELLICTPELIHRELIIIRRPTLQPREHHHATRRRGQLRSLCETLRLVLQFVTPRLQSGHRLRKVSKLFMRLRKAAPLAPNPSV